MSDDGSEAVVVMFLDNYIFSPKYNSHAGNDKIAELHTTNGHSTRKTFPAIAFVYYRDGKPVYRVVEEFDAADFSASPDAPECQIGNNFFKYTSAPYGNGYFISLDLKIDSKAVIKADFEWLLIESDFQSGKPKAEIPSGHRWNLAAPRSDVTGRIRIINKEGIKRDEVNFRGTGFHDNNSDDRWLPDIVRSWQKGRVHFPDATAVFFRYNELGAEKATTKLYISKDDDLFESYAESEGADFSRNMYGLRYPGRLKIYSPEIGKLTVKQNEVIESSFFYMRFLSEITLSLNDGKPRKGVGITEHLSPKALKYRWLDWITGMRIGI